MKRAAEAAAVLPPAAAEPPRQRRRPGGAQPWAGGAVRCGEEAWLPGRVVVAPQSRRSFTLITRHRLPDGGSDPAMAPAAVREALERLGMVPLIATLVGAEPEPEPSALAPALEVAALGARIGCGVLPCRDVAVGEAVCDYVGEVLSTKEARSRQAAYDEAVRLRAAAAGRRQPKQEQDAAGAGATSGGGMNYLLTLLEHLPSGRVVRTSVDPTHIGGVASCINHSCAPNLTPTVVRDGSVVPVVRFVASRSIAKGEELTFDYGDLYGGSSTSSDTKGTDDGSGADAAARDDTQQRAGAGRTVCLCGADACRGWLPFDATAV